MPELLPPSHPDFARQFLPRVRTLSVATLARRSRALTLEVLVARARGGAGASSMPEAGRKPKGVFTLAELLARARENERSFTEPEPTPEPEASTFPEAVGPFAMAVNTVAFLDDRKYGTDIDVLRDMEDLGALILRQPGRLQFYIDHLLYDADEPPPGGRLRPTMEALTFAHITDADWLRARMNGSFALAGLLTVAHTMRALGIPRRFLITFLDFGEGAPTDWNEYNALFDAAGVTAGSAPSDVRGRQDDPIGMTWDKDNIGQRIYDPVSGGAVDFDTAIGNRKWDLFTLDPGNAYKRAFYGRLASALGEWLQEHWHIVGDFIEGIEIGNELEVYHVRTDSGDPLPNGEDWGELVFACAWSLRLACPDLKIWLPALASYRPDLAAERAQTWPGKLDYVTDMLTTIQGRCTEHGLALCELVDGLDMHYYHMGNDGTASDTPQVLHYLPLTLRELRRRVLDPAADGYDWSWADDDGVERPPRITCIETSTNVIDCSSLTATTCPTTGAPTFESARPPVFEWDGAAFVEVGSADPTAYQGGSVWMRMALALAAGAKIVGWHCHIANQYSAFAGTGLREDFQELDAPPIEATMRPAWFAFRRFARMLPDASQVRVVWPVFLGDDTTFDNLTERSVRPGWSPEDCAWVLAFEGISAWSVASGWVYLVFVDPVWPGAAGSRPVGMRFVLKTVDSHSSRPQLLKVPTSPSAAPETVPGTSVDHYPVESWLPSPPTSVTMSRNPDATYRTAELQQPLTPWPALYLSSVELELVAVVVETG